MPYRTYFHFILSKYEYVSYWYELCVDDKLAGWDFDATRITVLRHDHEQCPFVQKKCNFCSFAHLFLKIKYIFSRSQIVGNNRNCTILEKVACWQKPKRCNMCCEWNGLLSQQCWLIVVVIAISISLSSCVCLVKIVPHFISWYSSQKLPKRLSIMKFVDIRGLEIAFKR